jgi:protein-disulfide isomerase
VYRVGGLGAVIKQFFFLVAFFGCFNFVFGNEEKTPPKKYLSDIVLGNPNAPHKVTMFFALDCEHCQEYEQTILPVIREKFIDTGRVVFTLTDFPITSAGLMASQLAWAKGSSCYLSTVNALMKNQECWNIDECQFSVQKKNPKAKQKCRDAFWSVAQKANFQEEEFTKTLENNELQDEILERRIAIHRCEKILEVPTFVVDGVKIEEILTPELLEKMIS